LQHPLRQKQTAVLNRMSNQPQAAHATANRDETREGVVEQARRKVSAMHAGSPSIQGLARNHQLHDASSRGIQIQRGRLDARLLLQHPRPAVIPPPLATRRMPPPIDADSGAHRAEPWRAGLSQPPKTSPRHQPTRQLSPTLPQGLAETGIRGILRSPQRLRRHSLSSLRIEKPRKNQDLDAADDAVAVAAEVPEPQGNVAAQSDQKKSPRTVPSPSLPVTGSLPPAVARRDQEMLWWNPIGSIGKRNWSPREKR